MGGHTLSETWRRVVCPSSGIGLSGCDGTHGAQGAVLSGRGAGNAGQSQELWHASPGSAPGHGLQSGAKTARYTVTTAGAYARTPTCAARPVLV